MCKNSKSCSSFQYLPLCHVIGLPLGNGGPYYNYPQGIPLFRNQHFTYLGNTTPTHSHLQGPPPFRNHQNTPSREQRPHSQPPTRHSTVPHIQMTPQPVTAHAKQTKSA